MYQKTYILDCLSKKQIVNPGKRNRYLVSNDHEPIVSRDLFYAVQAEFARRKTKRSTFDSAKTGIGRYSSKYAFSKLLVCGDSGGHFRRKTLKKTAQFTTGDTLTVLIMRIDFALILWALKKMP